MISSTRGTNVSFTFQQKNSLDKKYMHSYKSLKRILFTLFLIVSLHTSAQESGALLFQSASSSFDSFRKQFKKDSVLSFRSSKGYFPTLIHNLGYQATFTTRMKAKHFLLLGGTAAITFALIHYDQQMDDDIRPVKDRNPFLKSVSPHFTELGDYNGYMLLTGFGIYSIAFHKYKAFRVSLLASQAAITAGLWTRAGKILTGRMRPGATYNDPEYNADHWFGPFAAFNSKYNKNRGVAGFDAFPSGHTAAIFAMATVFSEEYKDYKAMPYVMYSVAGLVGVSRLIEHEHWVSDVFVGAIIGYLCGKQVTKNEHRKFPEYSTTQKKSNNYFYPINYAGVNGVGWKLIF